MRALQVLASAFPSNYKTPRGVPVTVTMNEDFMDDPQDPFRIGTALRCMSIIASTVAGCPLKAVDVETLEPVPIPAFQARGYDPTGLEIIETATLHLVGWGNAFLRKWRDDDGNVIGLQPIHPSTVTVEYDQHAQQVGLPVSKTFILADGTKSDEDTIMHVPGLSENGITGISLISRACRTFDIARENDRTAERLARKSFRLGGILATDADLDNAKAEAIQTRWDERTTGPDNAGKVAVIDKGLKFQGIDMSPVDAQFLESRRFSTTEIARLFGIPGWMINDQEKTTSWGTGMEQQFRSFVILTLKPYMQRIEQRVTQELLDYGNQKAEFIVEGLLRGDSAARAAFYNAGILGGWYVPNEVRAKENMPPVPWGDDPYRPYNESAASQNGKDNNAST